MTYAKESLARIWGKFSGDLQVPDSTIKLDYQSLLTEAKDERIKLIEELIGAEGMLTRLRPEKLMERRKMEAENLNATMKFRAMPTPIIPI